MNPSLLSAISDVRMNGVSLRLAARIHSVSYTTLHCQFNNVGVLERGENRKIFSTFDESMLNDLLDGFHNFGVPITDDKFLEIGREFSAQSGLIANIDKRWLRRFLRRYGKFCVRKAEAQPKSSNKTVTEDTANGFISILEKLEKDGFLQDGRLCINLDESGFKLGYNHAKAIVPIGQRKVTVRSNGDVRKQISVLACGTASGVALKPLVLYSGKVFLSEWFEETKSEVLIAKNDTGIMDETVFHNYIIQVVFPYIRSVECISQKAVIFLDGHHSHLYNLKLLRACKIEGVELVCLPSGLTSVFQPFDRNVFGPMKVIWQSHLKNMDFSNDEVTKNGFPMHLLRIWKKVNFTALLKNGFRSTGIFPFSRDVILKMVKAPTSHLSLRTDKPEVAAFASHVVDFIRKSAPQNEFSEDEMDNLGHGFLHLVNSESSVKRRKNSTPRPKRSGPSLRLDSTRGSLLVTDDFAELVRKRGEAKKRRGGGVKKVGTGAMKSVKKR